MEDEIKLQIERGELIQFPPIAHGVRPRRWCAVISRNYKTPQGIHREMLTFIPDPIRRTRHRIIPHFDASPLKLHDALEFGIEWDSSRPRAHHHFQMFGVITDLAETSLTLLICPSAIEAIELSINLELAHRRALEQQLRELQEALKDPIDSI